MTSVEIARLSADCEVGQVVHIEIIVGGGVVAQIALLND